MLIEGQYAALTALNSSSALLILYYALFPTAISYFLWFWGVGQVTGSTAAVFTGVLLISTLLMSYLFLGETFRWAHLVGGAAVLIAISLTALSHSRQGTAAEEATAQQNS